MTRDEALSLVTPVAAEQTGYVSAHQAAGQGVENRMLVKLAEQGLLRRVRRGVYVVEPGRAASRHEDLIGAYLELAGGEPPWSTNAPLAFVSHASAAALHELGTIIPGLPALTIPRRGARARQDVTIHVARIVRSDWTWLRVDDGLRLPVTTPARTIVDLARDGEEADYLEKAIRAAFPDAAAARGELSTAAARLLTRSATLRRHLNQLAANAWEA